MFTAYDPQFTSAWLLVFTDVLSGTELESWERKSHNSKIIRFQLHNTLANDYITAYVRMWTDNWSAVPLDENNTTTIKLADTYMLSGKWITGIKFIRTWVVDGNINLDLTIINK